MQMHITNPMHPDFKPPTQKPIITNSKQAMEEAKRKASQQPAKKATLPPPKSTAKPKPTYTIPKNNPASQDFKPPAPIDYRTLNPMADRIPTYMPSSPSYTKQTQGPEYIQYIGAGPSQMKLQNERSYVDTIGNNYNALADYLGIDLNAPSKPTSAIPTHYISAPPDYRTLNPMADRIPTYMPSSPSYTKQTQVPEYIQYIGASPSQMKLQNERSYVDTIGNNYNALADRLGIDLNAPSKPTSAIPTHYISAPPDYRTLNPMADRIPTSSPTSPYYKPTQNTVGYIVPPVTNPASQYFVPPVAVDYRTLNPMADRIPDFMPASPNYVPTENTVDYSVPPVTNPASQYFVPKTASEFYTELIQRNNSFDFGNIWDYNTDKGSQQSEQMKNWLRGYVDAGRGGYIGSNNSRYGFYPTNGDTVFGIKDKTLGRVKNGVPVGKPILRIDSPHEKAEYPHLNIGEREDFPDITDDMYEKIRSLDHKPMNRSIYKAAETGNKIVKGVNSEFTKISHSNVVKTSKGNVAQISKSKIPEISKVGGKALAVVGVAMDVYEIGSAIYGDLNDDDKKLGKKTLEASVGVGASWAGALGGAKAGAIGGAAIGSFFPVIGTAVGALLGSIVGGIIGSVGGRALGEHIVDKTYKGQ